MAWTGSLAASGQAEGIFADFTTSMGDFTVWLDASNAPRAVASFVGLATGEAGWADPQGNVWHKPFYDGTLFHRIAPNSLGAPVAIQGGGLPTLALSSTDRLMAVATNSYEGQLTVSNAPGISTNVLNLPVVTSNAPAVATNYMLNGVTFETNAPMITTVRIEAMVVSSNAWGGGLTNQGSKTVVLTNFSLSVQTTTNIVQMNVVITNGSGTNGTTIHSIVVQAGESNVVRAPIVLTNFVNAGYTMLENVTNGLAHSTGAISMANSGPNRDGSQFFITVTNMPEWNGGYTVFGHVTTGLDVVTSIVAVAVQEDRPVADVILHSVAIRREGAAATNFDIASQGVPVVESGPISVTPDGTNFVLQIELAEQSEMLLRESADLQSWGNEDWGFYTDATTVVNGTFPRSARGDTYFFHASRIRYPVPITSPVSPRSLPQRYFTFWWNGAITTKYEVIFASSPTNQGIYQVTRGTNAPVVGAVFTGDGWSRDAYSARLSFFDNSGKEQTYSLGFNPGQITNRFTGKVIDWMLGGLTYPISGTFTIR